ncbi:MAG: hypothetical protein H6713_01170 [Myxococcales bacterium]|nr:hypothetical protein [Myxococcales bacterium]MCB9748593.1 hypothetical protein [Myxococcales bacterium]
MMLHTRGSVLRLLQWQWKLTTVFVLSATAVFLAHELLGWSWATLPPMPLIVVGGAMGIFVSFRTNQCYDRWWEGRKLWGRMVNSSRHLADQVVAFLPAGPKEQASELQQRLIHRHAGYVHILRCLLRGHDLFADERVRACLDAGELDALRRRSNPTHALLERQQRELAELHRRGVIDGHIMEAFDRTLAALLDIQGGCERIKKTPLPRGYGFIANRLILAFGLLFPFALATNLGWTIIPINVLVSLSFALISEAGRVLEDPFTMFWNGLPLSQLSTMIEVNLRETLGEERLPEIPGPSPQGVLM